MSHRHVAPPELVLFAHLFYFSLRRVAVGRSEVLLGLTCDCFSVAAKSGDISNVSVLGGVILSVGSS